MIKTKRKMRFMFLDDNEKSIFDKNVIYDWFVNTKSDANDIKK